MPRSLVLAATAVLVVLILIVPMSFGAGGRLGLPVSPQIVPPGAPPWLDPAWNRRKEVLVNNPSSTAMAGTQLRIDLNGQNFAFNQARSDGGDLRLADSSGTTLLPLAVERFDPGASVGTLWTKLDLAAGASTKLYLYFSNPNAKSVSAPESVFDFWDQFQPSVAVDSFIRFDMREVAPVFQSGGPGAWDETMREKVQVLQDTTEWKLYYTGLNPNNQATSNIGIATSQDGKTFTRFSGNPIIGRPEQDQDPSVLKGPDGKYYLYTEVNDYYLDRFVSDDGYTWGSPTRVKSAAASPVVWYENGTWYLMYEYITPTGCLTAEPCNIHLATSPDGIDWTDSPANPVLAESDDTVTDEVWKDGSTYHLYYHRFEGGPWYPWHATSTDLVHWTNRQRVFNSMSSQVVFRDRSGLIRSYIWDNHGTNASYYLFYGKDALRQKWNGQASDGMPRLTASGLEIAGYEISSAGYQISNGVVEARVRLDQTEATIFGRAGSGAGLKFPQAYGFSNGNFGTGNEWLNAALTANGTPFTWKLTPAPTGQWFVERLTLDGSNLLGERVLESEGSTQVSVQGTHSALTQGSIGARTDNVTRQTTLDWIRTRKVLPAGVSVLVRDESAADAIPPTVTSVSPADAATGVSITAPVTAIFSEAVDQFTLNASTMALVPRDGTTPIAASITFDTSTFTATLRPGASLDPGKTYTATIKGGASGVKDLSQNPLAADKVWSFTTASAPTVPSSATSLSDLTWISATNGWGPVEKDKSNGESGSGDGHTLTLNGVTYAKGLGAHAPSDVRYGLGGVCTVFSADVGVDDEIAANGSVVFQVLGDGVKLYDSGVMTSSSATKTVTVDLTGRSELALIVTDGGDNNWYDHADWANARVSCASTDTTPPTVTSVSPANGATGVSSTATTVSATFSEAMSATSITTATFTLVPRGSSTPLAATLVYDSASRTAVLASSASLLSGASYTATVKGGASGVKDASGNALAADRVWSFTTSSAAPPPANATYLSDLTWISATNGWGPVEKDWSNGEQAAGDGHTITINGATYAKGLGTHAASEIHYSLAGACTTFTSDVGVDDEVASGSVVFQVLADGVKLYDSGRMDASMPAKTASVNVAGKNDLALVVTNAGDGTAGDHADWASARVNCGSTTADTTPPTVTAVTPGDGAGGVAVTTDVTATFSEAVDPTTATSSTLTLVKQGTTAPLAGTVTYDASKKQATLKLSASLANGATYTATVKGGSSGVKDVAGNALAADRVWTFTTVTAADTTAPTVTSVSPAESATAVSIATSVTATFSEALDSRTVTTGTILLVKQGATATIAASVTYDATKKTVTLKPSAYLVGGASYTATIKGGANGVKDLAGNPLAANKAWTFTTITAPPSGTSYVSDLTWTSATNGWGPVEKDMSVGDIRAGDGHPIRIQGATYAKGLGVHARSEIHYNLVGACTSFTSDVGLDDEVNGGTVVFQIWADGAKLWDSGQMDWKMAAKKASANVTGKKELVLIVDDGTLGPFFDHADWADARVACN